ncbi:MAG: metal-dependent hydrolase [Proteobacteria bacterium]|nr:metal-dependent hydrolase [Pseudomonadota bacterium]
MPSIITHAAVPLALYAAAERGRISPRLLAAGVVASMLPDIDVIAFALHIPYESAFGHRGATHSLLFAVLVAVIGALLSDRLHGNRWQAAAWVFTCAISHPLLDAMTSGGLGVAIAWPWSEARWFAPWRPILVSPIGAGFFSARGMATLVSELHWVWLPLFGGVALWKLINRSGTR